MSAPIKVCYIVSTFPRSEDDPEVPWLPETVRRLRDKGIDVEVLASSFRGLSSHELFGIKVHRFRYFPKRWESLTHDEGAPNKLGTRAVYKLAALCYILFGAWGAMALCARKKFDILHVHWPFPHGIFGYFASKVRGSKVILQFHGAELLLMNQFGFVKPVLRALLKRSDGVIANSSFTARKVREIYETEVAVIPFGAAVQEMEGQDKLVSEKRILYLGRLIERKGVEYLVRAMPIVRSMGVDAKLTIAGDGHARASIQRTIAEEQIGDRVEMAGKVSDEQKRALYRDCDVFVLPAIVDSRGDTEGLGVVLLEALSYQKPVIASKVGGIPDVIRDGETGLLVPEKDPQALAETIARVLSDGDLAASLGERGYQYAKRIFDWDRVVGEMIGLYAKVLRRSTIPD